MMTSGIRMAPSLLRAACSIPAMPYKLTAVITRRCASRCTNCRIWRTPPEAAATELSVAEWARVAQSAPWLRWVDFTGGEPTERDDLEQIAAEFFAANPRIAVIHFPTAAYDPDRSVAAARRLAAVCRGRDARLVVTISVDGPPEYNDRIRGAPGSFDAALRAAREIRSEPGIDAYLGITLHPISPEFSGRYPDHVGLLEATLAAAANALHLPEGRVADMLHINLPWRSRHYYRNEGSPRGGDGDLAGALRWIGAWRRLRPDPMALLERAYISGALRHLRDGSPPVPCSALRSSVMVDADGTVYPCTVWTHPLGSLRRDGFDLGAILMRQLARQARDAVASGGCPRCWSPCDAYPSLLASPLRMARAALHIR